MKGKLALVLLALASLVVVRAADACDACAATARTLSRPVPACQLVTDTTDVACPSHVYAVTLFAGDTANFTLCDARCPGAGASFNARLRLYDASCFPVLDVDDSCGNLPELTWGAGITGQYYVEVTGSTAADVGAYTLGWTGACNPDSCGAVSGDLGTITTACRFLDDVMTCRQRSYSANLVVGRHHSFSLCSATCPGAFADFDSSIEVFDPSGNLVATADDSCGDDAQVGVDATTTGTYCVRVVSRSGEGAFRLGYSVECQPSSALSLRPLQRRAANASCTIDETFTVSVDGTPDHDVSWSITPPPGGSATPASGDVTSTDPDVRFATTLAGSGTYLVHVEIDNGCGRLADDFPYELVDRAGPDLELSALSGCSHPIRILRDREDSIPVSRSEPKSLGCATPCTTNTLTASNPQYDVFEGCSSGSFSAGTGVEHPVTLASGARQNVIFGGAGGFVGTSHPMWRLHELAQSLTPSNGQSCLFDPPDTPTEPGNVGIETEWAVNPSPGLTMTLRAEVVAFGTDENDSGVRLTLGATNEAVSTETITVGVRWEIDYQNGGDDGPLCATVSCDPPELVEERSTEHEYVGDEIKDFYRIQNNSGSPIFGNFTNTTEIAGFPDTGRPDRLLYGRWGRFSTSAWDVTAVEGSPGPDGDSAVLYYFGSDASNGIVLTPGTSFTRSMVIFSSNLGADCSGFTPGRVRDAQLEACEGDCVTLGALAADACGSSSVTLVGSSAGAPPCTGNPCNVTFPTAGTYTYDWEATDAAGNATQGTTTVTVRAPPDCLTDPCAVTGTPPASPVISCDGARVVIDGSTLDIVNCAGIVKYKWRDAGGTLIGSNPAIAVTPSATTTFELEVSCTADPACATTAPVTVQVVKSPDFSGATAVDPATCSHGIDLSWPAATFFDGGGVYNVFRSEIDCADAQAQPPLVTGLTTTTWEDASTFPGVTYFYAVQAEDDPPSSSCGTQGALQGGPSTVSCIAAISDAWDGTPDPAEVWDALRVSHSGDQVTLDLLRARPLLTGEHFHVLKAATSPTAAFAMVNSEGLTATTWSETDTSAPLQFFDVRIANSCERESRKEYPIYPPGYDVPR